MRRLAQILLILGALAATPTAILAEGANVSEAATGAPGAVAQLIAAQRGFEIALKSGEPVLLLVAVRLARGVTLRPPTLWERVTEGDAPADQPIGKEEAPDPASQTALVIVQTYAGEDPDLQDLVYDLDAQLPKGRKETAVAADAALGVGQSDHWRMPLSGEVPAEIGLIGDGDGPLSLSITDETGALICAQPSSVEPGLCRFTPARNGFFSVTIRNDGTSQNSYRLLAN